MFALSSYDYALPKHLIANAPIYPREAAKLLVYERATGHITHTTFAHLLEFIPKDCIIALNNTRVLKARIYGKKLGTQTTREIFFHRFIRADEAKSLEPPLLESTYKQALESISTHLQAPLAHSTPLDSSCLDPSALALCQIRGRVKLGDIFACGRFYAQVVGVLDNGYRIARFLLLESTFAKADSRRRVDSMDCFDKSKSRNESKNTMSEKVDSSNAKILAQSSKQKPTPTTTLTPLDQAAALTMLEEIGHIPLPPYIKRQATSDDTSDYQSLFATQAGAIAAPTASLHLSASMLESLQERIAYLTLHIGAGTFASVEAKDIREHIMHTEALHITAKSLEKLLNAPSRLCVGTSTLRSVEYAARIYASTPDKPHTDLHAQCDIFLHPGNKPCYVEYLLTNFHLPKSTLTMLVASMVGYEQWREIYEQAIAREYRFYSYGDAMLIL